MGWIAGLRHDTHLGRCVQVCRSGDLVNIEELLNWPNATRAHLLKHRVVSESDTAWVVAWTVDSYLDGVDEVWDGGFDDFHGG